MFRSSNSQALVRLAHCDCIPSIHFARARILFQKIGPQIKKLDKIVSLAGENVVLGSSALFLPRHKGSSVAIVGGKLVGVIMKSRAE